MANCNPAVNGRGRKTLSDELDRLDAILDGLSEALTAAVAQAVADAVRAAMTDSARGPAAVTVPSGGPVTAGRAWRDRVRRAALRVWEVGGPPAARFRRAVARTARAVAVGSKLVARAAARVSALLTTRPRTAHRGRIRAAVWIGLGAGLSGCLAGWLGGPLVAAVACGVPSAGFAIIAAGCAPPHPAAGGGRAPAGTESTATPA